MAEWQKFDINKNVPKKKGRYWIHTTNNCEKITLDYWHGRHEWHHAYNEYITHFKEIEPHELPEPPNDL